MLFNLAAVPKHFPPDGMVLAKGPAVHAHSQTLKTHSRPTAQSSRWSAT